MNKHSKRDIKSPRSRIIPRNEYFDRPVRLTTVRPRLHGGLAELESSRANPFVCGKVYHHTPSLASAPKKFQIA